MRQKLFLWGFTLLCSANIFAHNFAADGNTDNPRMATIVSENRPAYVDLGLPSGLLWATCNIGASSPEEVGTYFAWGETETQSTFDWANYKYGTTDELLTKYCYKVSSGKDGFTDNKVLLEIEDDAARAILGEEWRTPNLLEYQELFTECTWTEKTINGVLGYEVKGENGNSIFLPFNGQYIDNTCYELNESGWYWTSNLSATENSHPEYAAVWYMYPENNIGNIPTARWAGLNIRPVKGEVPPSYAVILQECEGGYLELLVDEFGDDNYIQIYKENTVLGFQAKPLQGYEFVSWSDGNTENPRTITITDNVFISATFKEVTPATGTENGHGYVDLGLPSGLLWATCNVGASSPEGSGAYFAWGETWSKYNYAWSNTGDYKYGVGMSDVQDYGMYKYNSNDNVITLETDDDGASVNWGGAWRTPTLEEQTELRTHCNWEWIILNGTAGWKISSKAAGNTNSIFLPAAGYRDELNEIGVNEYGYYWSSSVYTEDYGFAYCLNFYSEGSAVYEQIRYCGLPIRSVCKKQQQTDITIELYVQKLTLHAGESYYLNSTVQPQDFDKNTLVWSSDNEGVVSVANGLVSAHQIGKATITVSTADNTPLASCVVFVVEQGNDVSNDVVIDPSNESVEFSWPAVENASSYIFIIYADAAQTEKVCTLTFDGQGYLIRIDFARKPSATRDSQRGFNFVVTGLESETTYSYTLDSYDTENTIIDRKVGEFTTSSDMTTGIDTSWQLFDEVYKVFENGIIYIIRNGERYTTDGRRIK